MKIAADVFSVESLFENLFDNLFKSGSIFWERAMNKIFIYVIYIGMLLPLKEIIKI